LVNTRLYIDSEGNGKICITLGQFVITVLGRNYSSSYLSLILAYSWSSSVILFLKTRLFCCC